MIDLDDGDLSTPVPAASRPPDDAMAPGSLTALEKTVIAQAVYQASSADLGAVARELNTHRLIEQRQGKPPVPWAERVRPRLANARARRAARLDGSR